MIRLFSKALLFALGFLFLAPTQARHIIGGSITYECLGNDDYLFTLKVYRDCNCQNCAYFDNQAAIGIYRCGTDIDCNLMAQSSTYATLYVPLGPVSLVEMPDYPCLIPPNVCVQEGIYTFTVNLPQSVESYHVSYQRCCRNETINNIIAPDETGATYSIEITPEAQASCNNSPTFNSFPPIVICAGQPLEYDHSATDPEGDLLLYKFCSPLDGGGNLLDNANYETCAGAAPNPACPPPYDDVFFNAPAFTPLAPMGGNPVISIDPLTGIITGTPELIGQYVVGVCVEEYRDGQLISTVFRDFQFNVASCDPLVVADIEEDQIISDQEFLINSCGETAINFVNQSFQQQYIEEWEWEFDVGGSSVNSTQWSPTINFPGIGEYNGTLMLNPGTECGDTAFIKVNIFPAIEADFTFDYDTCVAGPVTFTDLSTTGSCCLTGWNWEFGDGDFSLIQNPSHIYMDPGDIPVRLTVRDTNQCEDVIIKNLPYFPAPALIVVAPNSFFGCEPADIFFDNLSFPIDTTYDIEWHFGDGETGYDISPWHTYTMPGIFTVDVTITSPIGCTVSETFPDLIQIEPSPDAGFSFFPEEISILEPEVNFTDESQGAAGVYWTFGDGDFSSIWNPTHTYRDTGVVAVTQIVTHISGCKDTLIQYLDIKPEVRYFLPNAFTPNNDSVNEEYRGVGILEGATNFQFSIWNRWGELVFQTNDPLEGWNGTKNNTGKPAPAGVYVVLASFTGPRGQDYEFKGFATLLR